MDDDDLPIHCIIEFHYLFTVRTQNPVHTLTIKISRGEGIFTAIVLKHANDKGILVKNISSPEVSHVRPVGAMFELVKKYLAAYDSLSRKPNLTIVK